jgi:cytidyltransferase-like protein
VATALQIEVLKQIFREWVINDTGMSIGQLNIPIPSEILEKEIKKLEISNLIEIQNAHLNITPAGRSKFKVVLTGGAYDLLHKGHIVTLKEAKSLGDFLVVVVARDITVNRRKRTPIHSEEDRRYLLNELDIVDAAVLGDEVDHMRVVRRIKPDFVAIGADQDHIVDVLKEQITDAGMENTKIVRLNADYEGLATSKVIEEIKNREWN